MEAGDPRFPEYPGWGLSASRVPSLPPPTPHLRLLNAVSLPVQELRSAQACAPYGLQPTSPSRRRSLTPRFPQTCKFVIHLALSVSLSLSMFLYQYLDQGTDKPVFPLAPYLVSTSFAPSAGRSCLSRSLLPWGFGPHTAPALGVLSHCKPKTPSLPRVSPA